MADNLSDTNRYRTSIYAIYNRAKKIVYVGLTDYERDGDRFIEHVKKDTDYPWHYTRVGLGAYDSEDDETWPFYPRKLEDCKDFTPLETIAAEQYFWEQNGGLEGRLLNKNQPLTKATFRKYRTPYTYRGEAIGFPKNWEPKV